MNNFELTLIFMISASSALNPIQGSVSYSLTSSCEDILINRHGQTFLCITYYDSNLEIYENTGSGFQLDQVVNLASSPILVHMTDAGIIFVTTGFELYMLKKESDGTYASTTAATYSWAARISTISKD